MCQCTLCAHLAEVVGVAAELPEARVDEPACVLAQRLPRGLARVPVEATEAARTSGERANSKHGAKNKKKQIEQEQIPCQDSTREQNNC